MKTILGKKILFFAIITLFFTLSFPGCVSSDAGGIPDDGETPSGSPYWTGDGGKGTSLGIIVPESQGLNADLAYLPAMVQGVLVSNFKKYSAISVLDRVALDKVIAETLDATYEESLDIVRLGHVAQVGNMLTGKIMRTSSGYTLQINVTDTTPDARTLASYSGTCTVAQLDDQTAIQKAAQDLLAQMGVQLSDLAKKELNTTNSQQVTAQTVLAKGITAQKQGTEVAALSYFLQATAFDPTLAEAANRSSILAANISSGNIGDDARNDILWRRDWAARLTETESYFNSYFDNFFKTVPAMPYTLLYSTAVKQGDINYQTETLTIEGIETALRASSAWAQSVEPVLWSMQASVQAVQDGLNATGRKTAWGFDNWPQQSSFNVKPFGRQAKNFTIIVELVNSRNQVIGRQTLQTGGTYELPIPFPGKGEQKITLSDDDRKTVRFLNVKADDITDNLTIRIASVNGTPAETAAQNGFLQAIALSKDVWDFYANCKIVGNTITEYNGNAKSITIDSLGGTVTSIGGIVDWRRMRSSGGLSESEWETFGLAVFAQKQLTRVTIGDGITVIGDNAFSQNQLTSLVIPDSVTGIGSNAFSLNQLTSVTIGNGVTSIGMSAFAGNPLTSIIIPDSVTSIGEMAFMGEQGAMGMATKNQLTSITIGANVDIPVYTVVDLGHSYLKFERFYNKNGRKAGVYTYSSGKWKHNPR